MSKLEALGIAKRYRSQEVVKNLSISINSGEIVGLLGPNGAGKTTAFYMIVGLIRCDRGSIVLDGKDVTRLPVHRRARRGLGYLPQEASIFRKLTVAEIFAQSCRHERISTGPIARACWNLCSRSYISPMCAKVSVSLYQAASGGAWRSRGPWRRSQDSYFLTNRLRVSIRYPLSISSGSSAI